MTRKDYVKFAEMMHFHAKCIDQGKYQGKAAPADLWGHLVNGMASIFRSDNDRFDVNRFHKACGVEDA